ncbi:DNA alkylation repair protein [Virgibacillus ihumii]|uniref:DNA alkylation repair protein n=1 Tax=Virgibacillus ihumii TaxID=2686091 RepID=UPI00157D8DD3|nr:DNA alkylation repair protein [Virgibacillus ihumii]
MDTINAFVYELKQHHFTKAPEILNKLGTGARNAPKTAVKNKAVKAVLTEVNTKQEILDIAVGLADTNDSAAKEIAAHLLGKVYEINPVHVSEKLRILADDENWEVREWAAGACGDILSNYFGSFYNEMMNWTADKSGNVRRAAALAAKYAGKTRNREYAEPLLDLVEQLLTDSDSYVKKNLGQFAIGDGLLRYYPESTLARLDNWIKMDDEYARWNVAKIFSAAEGMKHICECKDVFQILLEDDRNKVKRAVKSHTIKLRRSIRGCYTKFIPELPCSTQGEPDHIS